MAALILFGQFEQKEKDYFLLMALSNLYNNTQFMIQLINNLLAYRLHDIHNSTVWFNQLLVKV